MGKTKKFRKFPFLNRKKKDPKTLAKGTYTELDVVRINSKDEIEEVEERYLTYTVSKETIPHHFKEKRVTNEITDNAVPDQDIKKNIIVIDETDSELDDVDSFHVTQGTSSNNKDVNFNVDVKKKKIIIEETDSEPEDIAFNEEVVQKEVAYVKSMAKIPKGLTLSCIDSKCADTNYKLISGNVSSLFPSSYEKKQSFCDKTENPLSNLNPVRSNSFDLETLEFQEFHRKMQPVDTGTAELSSLEKNDTKMKNSLQLEINNSRYKATSDDKKKIGNLRVKMKHTVLPQHKVETTAGTRSMNDTERKEFSKFAILKNSLFSAAEDRQIKLNWKTFCENNEWDSANPKPFLYMKHENKQFLMNDLENRKDFVRCLAHALPDRCLHSVLKRFRNLFSDPTKTDRYTKEEDRKILEYVNGYVSKYKEVDENDRRFANLASILNRTRASVWRRYQILKGISS